MSDQNAIAPENTAVRVALWRALHLLEDAAPHILSDDVGLKLIAPDNEWRKRPDMSPFTRPFRASILARARLIEDLVCAKVSLGIEQYVILGAGLDSFAQRHPELVSKLNIFEVDQPGPQAWKRQRLLDLNGSVAANLQLVPVDFEAGDLWWEKLKTHGFNTAKPAVVASTGVSMYLTKTAVKAMLVQLASLAPGSTFAMSFLLPIEKMDSEIKPGFERAMAGAQANGTPFISFFTPEEMVGLAQEAGFKKAEYVSSGDLARRYFSNRTDGLRPPNHAEEMLLAKT